MKVLTRGSHESGTLIVPDATPSSADIVTGHSCQATSWRRHGSPITSLRDTWRKPLLAGSRRVAWTMSCAACRIHGAFTPHIRAHASMAARSPAES